MNGTAEFLAEQGYTVSEWIEWPGGECPLDRRTLVQVRCRYEDANDETSEPRRASAWQWGDNDDYLDVRAYRVVKPV